MTQPNEYKIAYATAPGDPTRIETFIGEEADAKRAEAESKKPRVSTPKAAFHEELSKLDAASQVDVLGLFPTAGVIVQLGTEEAMLHMVQTAIPRSHKQILFKQNVLGRLGIK